MKFRVLSLILLINTSLTNVAIAAEKAEVKTGEKIEIKEDDNVSQVKGQIVPDGDRHQYYLDYKQWNVSTNPLGLLTGSYSLTGSYAFHKNFAVKADVNYFDPIYSSSASGSEVAVSVPIFFRKVNDGFSLEPGIMYRTNRYDGKTKTYFGPQVMLGYSWIWDSGLNVSAGAGMARNLHAKSDDMEKVVGNGYIRVGYAFN